MKEDILEKAKPELLQILEDLQESANPASLPCQNPKKWMEIAGLLLQGKGPKAVQTKMPGATSFYVIKKVEAEIKNNPIMGDIRKEMADEVAMSLGNAIKGTVLAGEGFARRVEKMTEEDFREMDLLDLKKCEAEGAKAVNNLTNAMLKLKGENIKKVQVIKAEGTLEEYFAALDKLNGKAPEKAIEAEVV